MDFAFDEKTEDYRKRLLAFMDEHVYPAEAGFDVRSGDWDTPPVIGRLQAAGPAGRAVEPLPARRARRRADQPAVRPAGRDHRPQPVDRAGRPQLRRARTPATWRCWPSSAPPQQQEQWLQPLLDGEIRSAFAMTEPEVASSDATNIGTRIERDGDDYVINGRKFYISGAMNPNCKIFIVMGKTDPDAARHVQQSMVLVPRDTPGLTVKRGMTVFGYDDGDHGGHAEVIFDDVRVPAANLIGDGGQRLRDLPGPPRPRPHPPLHAADRDGRAGARADVHAGAGPHAVRQAAGRAGRGAGLDRRVAGADRAGPAAGAQGGLADGHGRQQGRAHRDPGHQDRRCRRRPSGSSTRPSRRTARPGSARTRRSPRSGPHARTLRLADGPDEVHKRSLARRELNRYRSGAMTSQPPRVDGRTARSERTRNAIVDAHLQLIQRGRPAPDRRPDRQAGRASRCAHCGATSPTWRRCSRPAGSGCWSCGTPSHRPISPELPLAERIEAYCRQRARLLEQIAPTAKAAAIKEPFSTDAAALPADCTWSGSATSWRSCSRREIDGNDGAAVTR